MSYNVWNSWDTLKKVVLGNTYSPDFFKDIKNQNIKSALLQIINETHEDLENFENILKQFGTEVIRPVVDPNDNIMNYVSEDNSSIPGSVVPRGPLQPRDGQVVIGHELFVTNFDSHSYPASNREELLQDLNFAYTPCPIPNSSISESDYKNYAQDAVDWPDYKSYLKHFNSDKQYSTKKHIQQEIENAHFDYYSQSFGINFLAPGPSINVVGKDIYINVYNNQCNSESAKKQIFEWFKQKYADFRINTISVSGHSDGSFSLLKPGVIVSLSEVQDYDKTFPGWDVFFISETKSKFKIPGFWKAKKELYGKWWVLGQEENDDFNNFVQTWLGNWVGYVEESVFDLNVLMLDEHHVCVSSLNNKDFINFLKKHNIEPILVPWRLRYFWDGGLHCITLDLYRKGKQQDYFPNRLNPVFDQGYN